MKFLRDAILPHGSISAVAIGDFDGVHTGHIKLLGELCSFADGKRAIPVVYTFSDNTKGLPYLTSPEEKSALLEYYGVGAAYFASFESMRDTEPEAFVQNVLINGLHATGVVCGVDFRFGKGRHGDGAMLRRYGLAVNTVDDLCVRGEPVSSTRIRVLLENGEVEKASELLGRPYSFTQVVEAGRQEGRKLGFPTINMAIPAGRAIPAYGVYAVTCEWEGEKRRGVCGVGVRPTFFENGIPVCETHLLMFSGEMYGKRVKISFEKRIRDEMKFSSPAEFEKAVERDKKAAEEYFKAKNAR